MSSFFSAAADQKSLPIQSANALSAFDAKTESADDLLILFTPFKISEHFRRNCDIDYYHMIATRLCCWIAVGSISQNALKATDFLNLAFAFIQKGDNTMALAYCSAARSNFATHCIHISQLDIELDNTSNALFNSRYAQTHGPLLREQGQTDESITELTEGLVVVEKIQSHPDYFTIKSNLLRDLGLGYLKKENFRTALKHFEESLQVALAGGLKLFAIAMENYIALAKVRLARTLQANEPEQAKALFEEAAALFKQVTEKYQKFAAQYKAVYDEDFFDGNQDYASHTFHSGTAYCDMGYYSDAIKQLLIAIDLRLKLNLKGQLRNRIAEVYTWLAKAYLGNKTLSSAKHCAMRSLTIYQELPTPDQRGIQVANDILSQITAAQAEAQASVAAAHPSIK